MAYKAKFLHFKTKQSYNTERNKTSEGTDERKVFDAYISFIDEGPTICTWGKEYKCDVNLADIEALLDSKGYISLDELPFIASPSDELPKSAGSASSGSSEDYSRADHIHPLQTTISGNAGTATKLLNSRKITLTGNVEGEASFDGSQDIQINSTISNVDATKISTGTLDANRLPTIPIEKLPKGALERLVIVSNQSARFNLTTADVQEGDTVKQEDTGVMYFVVDTSNLNNESGYKVYTAGAATSVPWSGVTDKPTTLSGYGITDGATQDWVENTATSAKSQKLVKDGYTIGLTPNNPLNYNDLLNTIPWINSAGIIEIGRMVDFHAIDSSTDNTVRVTVTDTQMDISNVEVKCGTGFRGGHFITNGGSADQLVTGNGTLVNKSELKVGSATAADKLSSNKTISLTGSVTGSTTTDLSSNVSIDTTLSIPSGKLFADQVPITWQTTQSIYPSGLAFFDGDMVTIEYSQNNGESWTDYGLSKEEKQKLFVPGYYRDLRLGGPITSKLESNMLRIKIEFGNENKNILYCKTTAFSFNLARQTSNMNISIYGINYLNEKVLLNSKTNTLNPTGWTGINTYYLDKAVNFNGIYWPNDIPSNWTDTNKKDAYYAVVFEFSQSGILSYGADCTVGNIEMLCSQKWTNNGSYYSKYGSLYAHDQNQNAAFPNYVTAQLFISETGFSVRGSDNKHFVMAGNAVQTREELKLSAVLTTNTTASSTVTAGNNYYWTTVSTVTKLTGFSETTPDAVITSTQPITFNLTASGTQSAMKMSGLSDLVGTYYVYCLSYMANGKIAINGAVYE